jgi:hypothetical protein
MALYVVDTVSMFRIRYVVEAREAGHACDTVVCRSTGDGLELREFSQRHLDEVISDCREITGTELQHMLKTLEDNEQELSSYWLGQELVNQVKYDETHTPAKGV